MAKRIKETKVGDIFSVQTDEKTKKYMQYIASDLTQLNSDVIRAFKKSYPISDKPDLKSIVNDNIEFYAHCDTKAGIKQGLWELVGNDASVGQINHILFRDSRDYGNPKVKVSNDWWVWKINEDIIDVGPLRGKNRSAEIGVVFPPYIILNRIKTGSYGIFYPDFE